MASVVAYTKESLIERIKRHIADGWPDDTFSTSDREIMLYIDQALAATVVGQVFAGAKVIGTMDVPEGWLTTYLLTDVQKDSVSGYWYSTLPQPPVSLPLGYSISRVYFGDPSLGQSREVLPIKAKRVAYRINMPMPTGARYWVEGVKIWLAASDNGSLLDIPLYAQMIKTRTDSMSETLNLPDDAIEVVFNSVAAKLIQRMQLPKDVIQDDISAGNKSS